MTVLPNFSYSDRLVSMFPALSTSFVKVAGIQDDVCAHDIVERNLSIARSNLSAIENESALPSIKAWRAAYRATGTDPTKHRMAAESILRRIRLRGDFPQLHPLVMICNSLSARYAIPVAALDASKIQGDLCVQEAEGGETYLNFDDAVVELSRGEITFRDSAGQAHARHWSNRQSKLSAVSSDTTTAIIVAEALHENANNDLSNLQSVLIEDIRATWPDASISCNILKDETLRAGMIM